MYEQIARNKRNSVVLCVLFVAFVAFLGWVFGQVSAMGNAGVVIAVAVAVAWPFGSY